jgi:hypothetical protein
MYHFDVNQILYDARSSKLRCNAILLSIRTHEPPSEEDDCENEEHIAAHMCSKCNQVARSIPGKEDLRTCMVLVQLEINTEVYGRLVVPMAFPVAHATKFAATTTVFLVCPAMLRDIMLMPSVCAAQKLRTM